MLPYDPSAAYGGLPPGAVPYPPPGYYVQPAAPPAAPAPVRTAQAAPPKPVIRGQAPDEAPRGRAPVAMPSPQQLNVAARAAEGDWTTIHRRLQELGVASFQTDRLGADVVQCTCILPTAEAGRTHRIEAHGATEVEAARRALDEAQRWKDLNR